MAKAKPAQEESEVVDKELVKEVSAKPKTLAKVVQFYKGVELMGSRQSVSHTHAEIEVTPVGVKISSKKGRIVLVPWANVTGCELFP